MKLIEFMIKKMALETKACIGLRYDYERQGEDIIKKKDLSNHYSILKNMVRDRWLL